MNLMILDKTQCWHLMIPIVGRVELQNTWSNYKFPNFEANCKNCNNYMKTGFINVSFCILYIFMLTFYSQRWLWTSGDYLFYTGKTQGATVSWSWTCFGKVNKTWKKRWYVVTCHLTISIMMVCCCPR